MAMASCQRMASWLGCSMKLILDIPDELARELSAKYQNIGQAAIEALAAEAYEKEVLSLEQVRRLLKLPSCWEAREVLKSHGVWPGLSAEDVVSDMQMLATMRS